MWAVTQRVLEAPESIGPRLQTTTLPVAVPPPLANGSSRPNGRVSVTTTGSRVAFPVLLTTRVKLTRVLVEPEVTFAILSMLIEASTAVTFAEPLPVTFPPSSGFPSTNTLLVRLPKAEPLMWAVSQRAREAPGSICPRFQTTTLPKAEPSPLGTGSSRPTGRVSVTTTGFNVAFPVLLTVMVKLTRVLVEPEETLATLSTVISANMTSMLVESM